MAWPDLVDFSEAIQNPRICFADADLKIGQPVCDKDGLPRGISGKFACAYEVQSGGRRCAVRTFNLEVTDQQRRYQLISMYLGGVRIPYIVDFQYLQQGILVRGTWYPIVKMIWAEGMTLTNWVKQNRHRPDLIRDLAKTWRGMVSALYGLQMAHADLQQDNVMVTPAGEIKLIDYDGMYVPAMRGWRAPELGHPNWNHPRRTSDTFGSYLDQFPGLVGYLSLLAVAAEPSLLKHCDEENIILSKADFADPDKSPLLQYLKKLRDPPVQKLADALIAWCKGGVDEYTLENIIGKIPPGVTPALTTVIKPTHGHTTPVTPPVVTPPAPKKLQLRWILLPLLVGGIIILNIPNQSDQPTSVPPTPQPVTHPQQPPAPTAPTHGHTTPVTPPVVTPPASKEEDYDPLPSGHKAQVCTLSDITDKGTTNGTLYAIGYGRKARKRSDITIISRNNTKIELHLLIDSKVAYLWGSSNQGIKSPVEEKSVAEILGQFTNSKCRDWTPNNSVFQIPTNIKFTEITKSNRNPSTGHERKRVQQEHERVRQEAKTDSLNILLGNMLLDNFNRSQIQQILEYKKTGTYASWKAGGKTMGIKITRTDTSGSTPCREFIASLEEPRGKSVKAKKGATACRGINGVWRW